MQLIYRLTGLYWTLVISFRSLIIDFKYLVIRALTITVLIGYPGKIFDYYFNYCYYYYLVYQIIQPKTRLVSLSSEKLERKSIANRK